MKKIYWLFFLMLIAPLNAQKKWSLQDCFDYAMENNLSVIEGIYNRDIQKNSLTIAQKEYLPIVNASIDNNLQSSTVGNLQIGRTGSDFFSNNYIVSGEILLYNAGRIKKNINKNEYELSISNYNLEKIKNDVRLKITQQYLEILLKKEVKKIADESVLFSEKILKKAIITTEVGATAKIVEIEAASNLAQEKQKQKQAIIDIKNKIFALAITLQLDDYEQFDIKDVFLSTGLEDYLPKPFDETMEAIYNSQPDIKSARLSILSAKKQTEIVKTILYPSITLSTRLSTNYLDNLNQRQNQFDLNFRQDISINIRIPIFNKGISKLQIQKSQIKEQIEYNKLKIIEQNLKQKIQMLYFTINSNYENYLALIESEKSTHLAYDFTQKSYYAEKISIYDLNRVRNDYLKAKMLLVQAKYNYFFSLKILDFYQSSF